MPSIFLDTSALAKRYVVEAGSNWITTQTDPSSGNWCWISSVTPVELLAGLYRRVRLGTLTLVQAQRAEMIFRHELTTHFHLLDLNPAAAREPFPDQICPRRQPCGICLKKSPVGDSYLRTERLMRPIWLLRLYTESIFS